MKYFLIGVAIVLFIGCTNTVPPKVEYRLNSNFETQNLSSLGCKEKTLKVAQAFSSNTLMSRDMSYGLGSSKQYVYSESLWSLTPNRAITANFLEELRDSKLFKSVQISKSRSRNDYILEINIVDFMQYFDEKSTSSEAKFTVSLTFIDAKTNKVFATQTFTSKVLVTTLNANGGVEGLNKALADVLSQSNTWFEKVCK